jgi:hypothetical protein
LKGVGYAPGGAGGIIFVPNAVRQVRHNFISLDFLSSIHARDVRIGRTKNFMIDQAGGGESVMIPSWIAGL